MQTTSEHQKARIAAEVAARYGVRVMPDAVQIIPQGVSGFPSYVYQGNQLVVTNNPGTVGGTVKAMKAGAWRELLRKRRVMAAQAREDAQPKERAPREKSPLQVAADARRAQVADMAAKGATAAQIAAYLGIKPKSAWSYCRRNGIDWVAMPQETLGKPKLQQRYERALAFGQEAPRTSDDYAAFLGLSQKGAYNYVKARGLPYVHKDRTAKRATERAAQREREAAHKAEIAARREEVRHLHGTAMPMRAIAKKLGVGLGAIQRDIRALGLVSPKLKKTPAEIEAKKLKIERSRAVMRRKAQAAMDKRLARERAKREAEAA